MSKDPMQEILKRLVRLEKAMLGINSKNGADDGQKRVSQDGLPAHILKLKEGGFFKGPKTAKEVQNKLQPTYHCELDRVAMALLRLKTRKKLRKSSKLINKAKQVAYVW